MINLKKEFNQKLIEFYAKNISNLDIESLSYNIRLPLKIIEMFPNYQWNWDGISDNENINISFILKNKDKNFNWYRLSFHPNISVEDILTYSDLPWYKDNVSLHPNLNDKIVIDNLDYSWVLHYLANNKNISKNTLIYVMQYNGLVTNLLEYDNIFQDINVTINTDIQKKNDKMIREKINVGDLVIILDIEVDNILEYLSSYHFYIDEELYIQRYYANKIKNWWYEILSNPFNSIGIKYLEKKSKYFLNN